MKQTMLTDEKLILRAPEKSDLDKLYMWENDCEQWNVGNAVAPYSHKQLWDYIETYVADIFVSRQLRFVIEVRTTKNVVGTIDVFDFDPVNRHASLGIYIDADYRNQGYAKRALSMVCQYCLEYIGMHTLTAMTAESNKVAQNLFKSSGFSTCGRLRSWVRLGDKYEDVIILQRLQ